MFSGNFMRMFTLVVVYADIITFYTLCSAVVPF